MALSGIGERRQRRQFVAIAIFIVFFSFCVRAEYVVSAKVEYPIRGDISQYVLYAWNISHRGVFSMALPEVNDAQADSYRGPGYPALLASAMVVGGLGDLPLRVGPDGRSVLSFSTDRWMRLALAIQVLLGTMTVWMTMAVGRMWLSRRWTLCAGFIVALWPHLIVFTGVLLSETLFGFLLMLSLWLMCSAERAGKKTRMAAAGLSWGCTYLVNPVVALFPLAAAAMAAKHAGRSVAVVLVVAFALMPLSWGLRNTMVAGGGALQRLEENFVQGSWPQFHVAYNTRFDNAISRQIVEAIGDETTALESSPKDGIADVAARMTQDPVFYLAWYGLRKPYLLWDWSIRIGAGDIYFLPTEHSPFDWIPILALIKSVYELLNPLIFMLGVAAALGCSFAVLFRVRKISFALLSSCVLAFYLTGVHVVLQAEPRYSIPYRPLEVLLAVTAIASMTGWLSGRAQEKTSCAPPAATSGASASGGARGVRVD